MAERQVASAGPELAIVVPTLNEVGNVAPLVERLIAVLGDVRFEVVFVDDDSADGTRDAVRAIAADDPRIRLIHRVGRRGLASACLEGADASSAPFIAVMDADLQHDERILPQMLDQLRADAAEIVVGSRYTPGGGTGEWTKRRVFMSKLATMPARMIGKTAISDPMSGFFMLRRALLDETVPKLSVKGFKLLLDIVTSADRRLRLVEIPFTFRTRLAGESKINSFVIYEYILLLIDKTIGRYIPTKFVLFVGVGSLGALIHLFVLGAALNLLETSFHLAQAAAALCAMSFNYALNNVFTHRERRLGGLRFVRGFLIFVAVCTLGVFANVAIAQSTLDAGAPWWAAGLVGSIFGSVWNYSVSAAVVWRRRTPDRPQTRSRSSSRR